MPPNLNSEGIVQIALPFEQPTYKLGGPSLGEPSAVYFPGTTAQQDVVDEDDDEPVLRVTTRARFTYELDRFEKQAVLIINNSNADEGMTIQCIHSFDRHRFEFTIIETENDRRDENWQQIHQFFQQDFSNIGAVAVVTLSCPDQNGMAVRDNCIKEWDVLNYLLSDQPSTLQDKPKIFISEALEPSSPPVTNLLSDILIIQTRNITHAKGSRPLDLLCHEFTAMEGQRDLLEILSELSYKTTLAFPLTPLCFTHTLTKKILLDNNETSRFSMPWLFKVKTDPILKRIGARLIAARRDVRKRR